MKVFYPFSGLEILRCAFRLRMRNELVSAIRSNQAAFGLDLTETEIGRLAAYHELLTEHNDLLHLTAPCPPAEFATRHILESLTMLKHLPQGATFADVGSGGGLPAIPCLIVRGDLRGRLIESKEKKADFLKTACERLSLTERTEVIAKQFFETEPRQARFVACRALDKFAERLPRLVKWSNGRSLLFFGGEKIGQELLKAGVDAIPELMPLSERRYLYIGPGKDHAGEEES